MMDLMALQMQIYAFLHHRSRHKHIREKWRVKSAYKPLTVVRLTAGVPCRTVQAAEFTPGRKGYYQAAGQQSSHTAFQMFGWLPRNNAVSANP